MNLSSLSSWSISIDYRSVIGHADQQVAALGIEKRRDRLQDGVSDALIVLACFLQAPTQRGLELQRLRFPRLDEIFGVSVSAQVLIEQEVLDRLAERPVVRDPLVEVEIRVDDLLDDVLNLLVERQTDVLARVHPRRRVERRVIVELLHHLAERDAMLGSKIEAEAFVLRRRAPRSWDS